jgi:hypothetical protein
MEIKEMTELKGTNNEVADKNLKNTIALAIMFGLGFGAGVLTALYSGLFVV